jgi:hypothetical protein
MPSASVSSFELFELEMEAADSVAGSEERPAVLDALALEAHAAAHADASPPVGAAGCAAWMALAEAAMAAEPTEADKQGVAAEQRVVAEHDAPSPRAPTHLPRATAAPAASKPLVVLVLLLLLAAGIAISAISFGVDAGALRKKRITCAAPAVTVGSSPSAACAAAPVAKEALLGSLEALNTTVARLTAAAEAAGRAAAAAALAAQPAPRGASLADALAPAAALLLLAAAWRVACSAAAAVPKRKQRAVCRASPSPRKAAPAAPRRTPPRAAAAETPDAPPPPTPGRKAACAAAPQPAPAVATFASARLAARQLAIASGRAGGAKGAPGAPVKPVQRPVRASSRFKPPTAAAK